MLPGNPIPGGGALCEIQGSIVSIELELLGNYTNTDPGNPMNGG